MFLIHQNQNHMHLQPTVLVISFCLEQIIKSQDIIMDLVTQFVGCITKNYHFDYTDINTQSWVTYKLRSLKQLSNT